MFVSWDQLAVSGSFDVAFLCVGPGLQQTHGQLEGLDRLFEDGRLSIKNDWLPHATSNLN